MRKLNHDTLWLIAMALVLLLTALSFMAQAGLVGPRRTLQVPEEVEPFDPAAGERQGGEETIA